MVSGREIVIVIVVFSFFRIASGVRTGLTTKVSENPIALFLIPAYVFLN